MKRIERNTLNSLRKSISADTINVEIPTSYSHEGRQAIHEMLTTEGPFLLQCAVMEEDNVLPMTPPGGNVDEMLLEVK